MAAIAPKMEALTTLEIQNKRLQDQNRQLLEQLEVDKCFKLFKFKNKNIYMNHFILFFRYQLQRFQNVKFHKNV